MCTVHDAHAHTHTLTHLTRARLNSDKYINRKKAYRQIYSHTLSHTQRVVYSKQKQAHAHTHMLTHTGSDNIPTLTLSHITTSSNTHTLSHTDAVSHSAFPDKMKVRRQPHHTSKWALVSQRTFSEGRTLFSPVAVTNTNLSLFLYLTHTETHTSQTHTNTHTQMLICGCTCLFFLSISPARKALAQIHIQCTHKHVHTHTHTVSRAV